MANKPTSDEDEKSRGSMIVVLRGDNVPSKCGIYNNNAK